MYIVPNCFRNYHVEFEVDITILKPYFILDLPASEGKPYGKILISFEKLVSSAQVIKHCDEVNSV